MLYKTEGIALSYIKYKESSIIARILTSRFGLQSYIVNSVRSSKRGASKLALFQPFTLTNLVVYHKDGSGLQRISEIKCQESLSSIPFDPVKSAIAIFLSELLSKVLSENQEQADLFVFVKSAVVDLDGQENADLNFHLKFLIQASKFLGFEIQNAKEVLHQLRDFYSWPDRKTYESKIDALINGVNITIGNSYRRHILDLLIDFYRLQLDGIGELRSLKVLRSLVED